MKLIQWHWSNHLSLNYRTTGNILEEANRILAGVTYTYLDDGTEDLQSSTSMVAGEKPVFHVCSNEDEEARIVADSIRRRIAEGVPPEEIAIISRIKTQHETLCRLLRREGIAFSSEGPRSGIRVLTMHGCKGLEYTCVYIIGVNRGILPLENAFSPEMSDDKRNEIINAEKMLLHVAMTRARKSVEISSSGMPSEFLKVIES